MMKMLLIILFVTIGKGSYCDADYQQIPMPDGQIQYVQLFIRHGDRAPMDPQEFWPYKCYKANITSDESVSKNEIKQCDLSELTIKGHNQHMSLGNRLRHYFRNANFDSKATEHVYVRASNKQRTVSSALNLMKGIFGKNMVNEKEFHDFIVRQRDENIAWTYYDCDKANKHKASIDKSHRSKSNTMKKVMKILGIDKNIMEYPLNHINDYLNTLICHGEDFPCKDNECVTQQDYEELWSMDLKEHEQFFGNKEQLDVLIGFFMNDVLSVTKDHFEKKKVIQQMVAKNQKVTEETMKDDISIALFSGHDTTIYPMLTLFDHPVNDWPPYASYIMFEYIGESMNDLKVRVIFNGKVLTYSGCNNQEYCDLNDFTKYLQQYIPSQSSC